MEKGNKLEIRYKRRHIFLRNKSDTVKRKKQNKLKIQLPLLLNSGEVNTDTLVGSSRMNASSTCESKTIREKPQAHYPQNISCRIEKH